jgi:uncharacterized membrane protein
MDDITKADLVFLGLLYILQSFLTFFGPYVSSINPTLSEVLTGISNWPGTADLISNFGIYYTLILGIFAFISGFGLMKEKAWAWGQAVVVLTFIVIQSAIIFISAIISGNFFNIISIINLLILIISIFGILIEKPWQRSVGLERKIKVASISYDKVKTEELALNLHIKSKVLLNKIIDMIAKNELDGTVVFPYLIFDCNENLKRIKNKGKIKVNKGKKVKKLKTKSKKDIKGFKYKSPKITKIDIILLGILYLFQGIFYYFGYILSLFYPEFVKALTGITVWPSISQLLANYGITYKIIIGLYSIIGGIGLLKNKDWAFGLTIIILVFIILDNAVGLTSLLINEISLSVLALLKLILIILALIGLFVEKPWKSSKKMDHVILTASISYDRIKPENLAERYNLSSNALIERTTELISKECISGTIKHPYIYFECDKNKKFIVISN